MKRRAADILLVEDDSVEVELTLHSVRKHCAGCLVDVARDGEEAIDYLSYRGAYVGRESAQPRLVMLDINLPRKTGLEVLAAIKADARIRLVPVVMLTSSRSADDVIESYRCGANGYVVKPMDFSLFDQAIRSLCLYWLQLNALPRVASAMEAHPPTGLQDQARGT